MGDESKTKAQLIKELNQLRSRVDELETRHRDFQKSEEKYRLLAENATDVIWTLDLEGRFTYMSPSSLYQSGWTPEEMLSRTLKDHLTPESFEKATTAMRAELDKSPAQRAKSVTLELQHYRKDGSIVDVEVIASGLFDENGEPIGVQGSTRTITARRRAEQALRLARKTLEDQKAILEEKNIALRETLHQFEQEKTRMGQELMANLQRVLLPMLERLKYKGSKLDQNYLDLMRDSIASLAAPFASKLESRQFTLTPTEMEICHLIRQGMSSKEIANYLGSSVLTVKTHRRNIRKKLKLARGENLGSFLKSLAE